jgi:hypothetical protein
MGKRLLPGQSRLVFSSSDTQIDPEDDLPLGQEEPDAAKTEELDETQPAIDVQVNDTGASSTTNNDVIVGPREEIPAVTDLSSLLLSASPLCSRCRCEVDPFRSQVKSKAAGLYMCNNCHSKCVLISRNWGANVLNQFKEMSEDEQVAFWQSIGTLQNYHQVKEQIANTLASRRCDRLIAASGGKWLPLSVWAQQGFNTADIEARCTDTMTHPVLGLCYRVSIASLDRSSMLEQARTQVLESLSLKPRVRNGNELKRLKNVPEAAYADEEPADDELAKESDDAESSNSDSSTSSDKKKNKRKSKSSKKANKKKTKADKQKEKAAQLKAAAAAQAAAKKAEASAQAAAKKAQEKAASQKKANALKVKQKLLPFATALDKAAVLV